MNKNVIVLVHDYWHSKETISPLMPMLFDESEWNVEFTTDPKALTNSEKAPDLFVTFKDPIENDQIPTPIWCDDEWSRELKNRIENGMGFMAVHCGVTDLPKKHIITNEIFSAHFVTHPPMCEVEFKVEKSHPVTDDVSDFTFPEPDEHYVIEMTDDLPTEILAYTFSQHGRQPAVWVNTVGSGKVCCMTPGHTTVNLSCPEYLTLMKNALKWCTE